MKQREERFMETMNEILETKRQIATSQQEEDIASQQKTGFLKQIFSKKR